MTTRSFGCRGSWGFGYWALLACALGGLSGCDGCGSDKPYTPFGVASTLPSPPPPPPSLAPETAAPAAPSASSGFARRPAELLPGAPLTARSGDQTLTAPNARAFAQLLPADFDGDQKPDALAWLTPAPGAKDAPPGELWYFGNGAAPKQLLALPGFVPTGPDCTLGITLTQTGPRSATIDTQASCKASMIARAPQRALVVVSPVVEKPVLLTLRIAGPAPDETLNFTVDSSDQDQDGRDDVRVTASVAKFGTSEAASAELAWLERAAGTSRLASEPVGSLLRAATRMNARAHGKHTAVADAERPSNAIRLLSALCAEGGVPRVFDEDGSPFRCGDLSRVVDELMASTVDAALAQGDVLEAFAAYGRDGWYFGKVSATARKALERSLLRAVSKLEVKGAFAALARPSLPRAPRYSPLWFEADGSLLVRGDPGVSRVSGDHSREEALAPEAGAPSWPLQIIAENGAHLTGTTHACDRSELLFNQNDASEHPLPALMTRLLAARPASCAGRSGAPQVTISPLAFDHGRLDAIVGGSHVLGLASGATATAALPALGTARSPDGRSLVVPTSLGLLLTGDRKELWQLGGLHEHADVTKLSDCVVSNGASAVACIEAGHVVMFDRPEAAHPAK